MLVSACSAILVARSLSVAEAAFLRALELSPGDDKRAAFSTVQHKNTAAMHCNVALEIDRADA